MTDRHPGALPQRPDRLSDTRVTVWRPTPTGRAPDGRRVTARRVVIVMPQIPEPRRWLRSVCGPGTRPEWDGARRCWLVARAHLRPVVAALEARFGAVAVCVDVTTMRACGTWCRDAEGDECDCACLGENHGGGAWVAGWAAVSDEWVVTHQVVRRWFRSGAPPRAAQTGPEAAWGPRATTEVDRAERAPSRPAQPVAAVPPPRSERVQVALAQVRARRARAAARRGAT